MAEATIIQTEHEKFLKGGGKPAPPEVIAKAKQGMIDAEKAIEKASKALEKAKEGRHSAAAAMIAAVGAKVRVDLGEPFGVMVPSSRGEKLFYRSVGEVAEPVTV